MYGNPATIPYASDSMSYTFTKDYSLVIVGYAGSICTDTGSTIVNTATIITAPTCDTKSGGGNCAIYTNVKKGSKIEIQLSYSNTSRQYLYWHFGATIFVAE